MALLRHDGSVSGLCRACAWASLVTVSGLTAPCQPFGNVAALGHAAARVFVCVPVRQERMEKVMGVRVDAGGGAKPKSAVSALFAQSTTAQIMNEARRWASVVGSGQCALR